MKVRDESKPEKVGWVLAEGSSWHARGSVSGKRIPLALSVMVSSVLSHTQVALNPEPHNESAAGRMTSAALNI